MTSELFDVVIIGAGISGISAAHHLMTMCPGKSFVILEQRQRIGGTWDLFRYPGIRSDSDMLTMGYSFRPWTKPSAISPGGDIRQYIEDTAREDGSDQRIRFSHRIQSASWSSEAMCWTLDVAHTREDGSVEPLSLRARFLWGCAGYYRYDAGYTPELPGRARFQGPVIHPQHWPEDLDYAGKRVVIIGSGATAITLVPAMAKRAAHVTMLQRSPTYILSAPGEDRIANALRKVLPSMAAYKLGRWKNVAGQALLWGASRRQPWLVKRVLQAQARKVLGDDYDIGKHFTPRYEPWDQRLCLIPDDDLYLALRDGRASVVTDTIETLTATGIQLRSGTHLDADIIVTATGLVIHPLGGLQLTVDGRKVDMGQRLLYRGMMLSDVPNMAAVVFGYLNASWTLRADLVNAFVCKLLNHMDDRGAVKVTPRTEQSASASLFEGFSAGYVQRGIQDWPKQGATDPWRVPQSVIADMKALRQASPADPALQLE